MSIKTEIARINNAKAGLKTAIENSGVTVGADVKIDGYPTLVASITEQINTRLDEINGEVV